MALEREGLKIRDFWECARVLRNIDTHTYKHFPLRTLARLMGHAVTGLEFLRDTRSAADLRQTHNGLLKLCAHVKQRDDERKAVQFEVEAELETLEARIEDKMEALDIVPSNRPEESGMFKKDLDLFETQKECLDKRWEEADSKGHILTKEELAGLEHALQTLPSLKSAPS